jgi:hypothetical protein
MRNDRMKNDRIKSDRIKNDRIKSDRIKTDRIKSITDPTVYSWHCIMDRFNFKGPIPESPVHLKCSLEIKNPSIPKLDYYVKEYLFWGFLDVQFLSTYLEWHKVERAFFFIFISSYAEMRFCGT